MLIECPQRFSFHTSRQYWLLNNQPDLRTLASIYAYYYRHRLSAIIRRQPQPSIRFDIILLHAITWVFTLSSHRGNSWRDIDHTRHVESPCERFNHDYNILITMIRSRLVFWRTSRARMDYLYKTGLLISFFTISVYPVYCSLLFKAGLFIDLIHNPVLSAIVVPSTLR